MNPWPLEVICLIATHIGCETLIFLETTKVIVFRNITIIFKLLDPVFLTLWSFLSYIVCKSKLNLQKLQVSACNLNWQQGNYLQVNNVKVGCKKVKIVRKTQKNTENRR